MSVVQVVEQQRTAEYMLINKRMKQKQKQFKFNSEETLKKDVPGTIKF
jgi:hypothetical protein